MYIAVATTCSDRASSGLSVGQYRAKFGTGTCLLRTKELLIINIDPARWHKTGKVPGHTSRIFQQSQLQLQPQHRSLLRRPSWLCRRHTVNGWWCAPKARTHSHIHTRTQPHTLGLVHYSTQEDLVALKLKHTHTHFLLSCSFCKKKRILYH